MRNQKRKLIPDLLRSFSNLRKEHNNIVLYLHTSYPEKEGWNLPSLLLEYDVADSVYLTYRCRHCGNYWPSVFVGQNAICPRCEKIGGVCGVYNPITNSELNNIYNLFDVYVQYAICEGFGIPQVEAASCGVPVITIDYGAMGDVGRSVGAKLVPIVYEFRELETEADRCYPNNEELIKNIKYFLSLSIKDLVSCGNKTRQLLLNSFSWDKTANKIMSIIDHLDISKNYSWESTAQEIKNQINIPKIDSNRDFIYYLIDNFIKDKFLKKTNLVQNMIKDLDNGLVIRNGAPLIYTRTQAVKELEVYINNKVGLEKIRTNQATLNDQLREFVNYQ